MDVPSSSIRAEDETDAMMVDELGVDWGATERRITQFYRAPPRQTTTKKRFESLLALYSFSGLSFLLITIINPLFCDNVLIRTSDYV